MRRRSSVLLIVLTAASLVLSGCGFTGLYSASLPGGADLGSHPFTVTAYFKNVLDLVPQSAVKVNDIAVGKVTAISLTDCKVTGSARSQWCAKVKMEVNDSVQLPSNARALITQTSLLGEKYVSLMGPASSTGESKTLLGTNSTIPLSSTQSAPEVEEVLGALSLLLNQGGLQQIQLIAKELNAALSGHESDVRDLITQLNTFVGTLDNQKTKITNALDSIDRLARTLNKQKQILLDALDTFPGALKVLSSERHNLVRLLTSLSNLGSVATDVIQSTQTNLVKSLKALDPAVVQLTRAGDALPKALRIAGTFPFPLGTTRQFVKGDYANLATVLNLDLTKTLCGLIKVACAVPGSSSSSSRQLTGSTGTGSTGTGSAGTGSAGTSSLAPTLIGTGR